MTLSGRSALYSFLAILISMECCISDGSSLQYISSEISKFAVDRFAGAKLCVFSCTYPSR